MISRHSKRRVVKKPKESLAPLYWAVGITGSLILAGLIIIVVILFGDGANKKDQIAEQNAPVKGRQNSRPKRNQNDSPTNDNNVEPERVNKNSKQFDPSNADRMRDQLKQTDRSKKGESLPTEENNSNLPPVPAEVLPPIPAEYNVSWSGQKMDFEIVRAKFATESTLGGGGRYLILIDTDSFDIFDVQDERVILTVDIEPGTELTANMTKIVGYHQKTKQLSRWDLATGRLEMQKTVDISDRKLTFESTPYADDHVIMTDGVDVVDIHVKNLRCNKIPFEFGKIHVSQNGKYIMREGAKSIGRHYPLWKESRGSINPEGIKYVSSENAYFVDEKGSGSFHRGSEQHSIFFNGVYKIFPAVSEYYFLQWPDRSVGNQAETHAPFLRHFRNRGVRIKLGFLGAKTLNKYLIPSQAKIVETVPGGIRCIYFDFHGLSRKNWHPDLVYANRLTPRVEELKRVANEFKSYDPAIVEGRFKLPFPYTRAFFGQGGNRICFYHPDQQKISILDTVEFRFLACIPVSRECAFTANSELLYVFDKENKQVDKWELKTGQHLRSVEWDAEMPDEVVAANSKFRNYDRGPILARFDPPPGERKYRFELIEPSSLEQNQYFNMVAANGKPEKIPWERSVNESVPPKMVAGPFGFSFVVADRFIVITDRQSASWGQIPEIGFPMSTGGWINDKGFIKRVNGKTIVSQPALKNARVVPSPKSGYFLAYKVPSSIRKSLRRRTEKPGPDEEINRFIIKDLAVMLTNDPLPTEIFEGINIETDRQDLNDMRYRLFLLPKQKLFLSTNVEKDELKIHLLSGSKQPLNREGLDKPKIDKSLTMKTDANTPETSSGSIKNPTKPVENSTKPVESPTFPVVKIESLNGPAFTLIKDSRDTKLVRQDARIKSFKMPATMSDYSVGGAGRYIAIQFKKIRKIAIFDVQKRAVKGYIDTGRTPVRFAAGLEKLIIIQTKTGLVSRWDLESMTLEKIKSIPPGWGKEGLFLGACSQGPAIISPWTTLDLGSLSVHGMRFKDRKPTEDFNDRTRISVDGKYFANKTSLYIRENEIWKQLEKTLQQLRTDWENQPIEIQRLLGFAFDNQRNINSDKSSPLFNCYVDQNNLGFYGLNKSGSTESLRSIHSLSNRNTVYAASVGQLIVFSNQGVMNCLSARPIFVAQDIRHDSLHVYSNPFPVVRPGEYFVYKIRTTKPGRKLYYRLRSPPAGMTVSIDGKITWRVPKSFVEPVGVRVDVTNGVSGIVQHEFTLSPRSKPPTEGVDPNLLAMLKSGGLPGKSAPSTDPDSILAKNDSNGKSGVASGDTFPTESRPDPKVINLPTASVKPVKKPLTYLELRPEFYKRLEAANRKAIAATGGKSPYEFPIRNWTTKAGKMIQDARFFMLKNDSLVILQELNGRILKMNLLDLSAADILVAVECADKPKSLSGVLSKSFDEINRDAALSAKLYNRLAYFCQRIESEDVQSYLVDIVHPAGFGRMDYKEIETFRDKSVLETLYSFEFRDIVNFSRINVYFESQRIGFIYTDGRWRLHAPPQTIRKLIRDPKTFRLTR